ncbi:MAG: acyltransferase [Polyangiaceae bacterium]
MKAKRIVPVLCALTFPFGLALVANGCGDKETDGTTGAPAAETTTSSTTPTPTPTVVMVPEEDAGADADAADDADAAKPTGNFDPTGVRACCQALQGNAVSAPLDQKPLYLQAAAVCNGLINNPEGRKALVGIRGMLRGANMPAQCK